MTELEVFQLLGIVSDPEKNRVPRTIDLETSLSQVVFALDEQRQQKKRLGTVNKDLWLEFILWHSLN